jgi:hypothetical protein
MAAVARHALLAVAAVGVMAGLFGMHAAVAAPEPAASGVAVQPAAMQFAEAMQPARAMQSAPALQPAAATESASSATAQGRESATPSTLVAPATITAMTVVADASMPGLMNDMGQCMETCCLALIVMLALAVSALPGLLGRLGPLRPRARLALVSDGRALRGLDRNLTLGVLRI